MTEAMLKNLEAHLSHVKREANLTVISSSVPSLSPEPEARVQIIFKYKDPVSGRIVEEPARLSLVRLCLLKTNTPESDTIAQIKAKVAEHILTKYKTHLGKFDVFVEQTKLKDYETLEKQLRRECEDEEEYRDLVADAVTMQIR